VTPPSPARQTVRPKDDESADAGREAGPALIRRSLPRQIVARLRAEIIAGKWAPGERLPSNVLCERFGVSHIPVREAFKILESEGFVVLMPNRAAAVTEPTAADTEGKLQVLDALETLAAGLACRCAPDAVLKHLALLHEDMEAAYRRDDAAAYHRINMEIHDAIVRAGGNQTLADFHGILTRHVERVRALAQIREMLTSVSLRQHKKLLAALLRRDEAAAQRAMEEHRAAVRRILLQRPAVERKRPAPRS
jgi:DNA-binding GntR family transcriptional regulator